VGKRHSDADGRQGRRGRPARTIAVAIRGYLGDDPDPRAALGIPPATTAKIVRSVS
jgi:hypothetical protein